MHFTGLKKIRLDTTDQIYHTAVGILSRQRYDSFRKKHIE